MFDTAVPFFQTGYLLVTGQPEIMAKLHEAAQLQASMGLTDVHILDPEQLDQAAPWMNPEGLLGGCWTPGDGRVTPPDGVRALINAAKARGAQVREHWPVREIAPRDGQWLVSGPQEVEAQRVVVCAGYWSSQLMRPFGLDLTIRPWAPSASPRCRARRCR